MSDSSGQITTVWATDRTDADGEQANLTVGQVNRITDTFTENDKNLAKADISKVAGAAALAGIHYQPMRPDECWPVIQIGPA